MLLQISIYMFLIKFGHAQLNGEFWWLNDNLASYLGTQPPKPQFENLSESDTDESARIIFRENSIEDTDRNNSRQLYKSDKNGQNIIRWPDETEVYYGNKKRKQKQHSSKIGNNNSTGDHFIFRFPDDPNPFTMKNPIGTTTITVPSAPENETSSTEMTSSTSYNVKNIQKLSENICTHIKKRDCEQNGGVQLNNLLLKHESKASIDLVCCFPPPKNKKGFDLTEIYFPDTLENIKRRFKRSDNVAQRQRNVLLKRRYDQQNQKSKPKLDIRISTPDYEYDDPYWNIKTAHPNNQKPDLSTVYNSEEYNDDYVVEIPRPLLTGTYSGNERRPPGWIFTKPNKGSAYGGVDDYDDDDSLLGYSTIDPRIESSTTQKSRPKIKPMSFTTAPEEAIYNAESQTISFSSYPDFNVLQNFKLLNVFRNKKRYSKIPRSTAEMFSNNDSMDTVLSGSVDTSSEFNSSNEDRQVFKDCVLRATPVTFTSQGKQIGDTENGSHPWLALLVTTENIDNIYCYASLIHPRAAITAAVCVHSSQKDIILITGLWNLNERVHMQRRKVSVFLHSKYKNGELNNNLAILHWKYPLKLGVNVQPVCLSQPHFDNDCMLVGWGGFNRAMQPQAQWQRASVNTCKDRLSLKGVNLPTAVFCASVRSHSTVTGIGGSLICNANGHLSAVGVAVSRDSTLVILPIYDWAVEAIGLLQ